MVGERETDGTDGRTGMPRTEKPKSQNPRHGSFGSVSGPYGLLLAANPVVPMHNINGMHLFYLSASFFPEI